MYKYISLGRHCDVAFNIKKHTQFNEPTHFFDLLRTDFKCVLYILNLKNIESLFNIENINIDKITYKLDNDIRITLKSFENDKLTCMSHHDVCIDNYNEDCIIQFIEKYKRRFNRLIDLINSNNEIIFIYRVTENAFNEQTDTELFINTILSINKNAIFCLVLLVENDDNFLVVSEKNYLKINIKGLIDTNISQTWMMEHVDWSRLFNIIQESFPSTQ
jgi:hypothetical protein